MTIQQIVAKKLKLYARRRVVTLLDGNYDSIFKGKGVELESLRPYVHGDSIKDIDWRATARTGNVHTRLYTPLRDQRILVVVDSSSSMQLPSKGGMSKKDAVFGLVVMLGMFVNKNRDMIASCIGRPDGTIQIGRFGYSNNHIETTLRDVDSGLQEALMGNPPDVETMLKRAMTSLRQRTAIFVITDSTDVQATLKSTLGKLSVKHQLFWLHIEPSSPFVDDIPYSDTVIDIESKQLVKSTLASNKRLKREWNKAMAGLSVERQKICKSTGVAYGEIIDTDNLPTELRKMFLQAKNYAKRR